MTPSKKGKATCIKIERKKKAEADKQEHHHVAGGEHKGLVINREAHSRKSLPFVFVLRFYGPVITMQGSSWLKNLGRSDFSLQTKQGEVL